MISAIFAVSSIGHVDLLMVLLLLQGPLATRLKESSLGLGSLNAYVSDCRQIGHHFGLLQGYLLHSLDIADPITKDIDDLNILYVRDIVHGIAEMFYIVLEALIMLLLDGVWGLYTRWTLICTLEVSDEYGT
jgi:hypothetical protein